MKKQQEMQPNAIYDRAREHFLGKFPDELPIEQAYLHIGIYLGWMIEHKLYSEEFLDEGEIQMYRFEKQQIGCTVLSEIWDGHLEPTMFNTEGSQFTEEYYLPGSYMEDYIGTLCKSYPTMYHVADTWDNYELMNHKITERFQAWKKAGKHTGGRSPMPQLLRCD